MVWYAWLIFVCLAGCLGYVVGRLSGRPDQGDDWAPRG